MIRHFIYKEIVESMSGPKFLITLAICAALIIFSVYSGYLLYEEESRWHATALAENQKAQTDAGSYGALKTNGAKAIREPSRMSIFVKGVDSTIGKAAKVGEDPEIVLRDSRFGLNPVFAIFGELDLAFIVKMILSLFALLFSYNAISGERELGTLKQVFSNSIGKVSYIIGKTIGGLITLLVPFIVPMLLSLLMLMVFFNVSFSGEEWGRIGLMTLVFFLYLAVFYMAGMMMSALTRNSFVSFLLCLFIWVLSVAIIPKAAVEAAGQISPAPSIDAIEAQRAALRKEYYKRVKEITTKKVNELIAANKIDDRNAYREARESAEKEAREPVVAAEEAMLREYERRQVQLLNTATALARFSPTACVTFAANRIANTDANLREHLLRSLRRYRDQFIEYADEKIKENPDKASSGVSSSLSVDEDEKGRRIDFSMHVPEFTLELAGLPKFSIEKEGLAESATAILPDIAVLALLFIAAFAAAFVAFLRYDVR
jgi:ABC-type transport system involved in multi-copper enzyme maturation permease subunit